MAVRSIFKNISKIKICGNTAAPLRASKLNSSLCASNHLPDFVVEIYLMFGINTEVENAGWI